MKTTLLLLMVTFAEATIGVFVKLTDERIPIHTLNFYALTLAALFLGLTLPWATGQRMRIPWTNLKDTALIGALIAAQISVFNFAMTQAPIANVVIFWSVAPFFVFILSAMFLHEPVRKIRILIFLFALVGIVLAKPLAGGHMLGNLIALGDGAVYAAMIVYMRSEGRSEASNDVFWFMAVAALLLSPAPLIFGPGAIGGTIAYQALGTALPVMLWAVCLGVVSTGCAYLGISLVLQRINANVYSLIDIIVSPVVASLLGFLVFREIPSGNIVSGGALILGAGFWLSWDMSKTAGERPASE